MKVAWRMGLLAALLALTACDGADPLDGGVEPCASDEDCDDGRFCNGAERCLPDDPSADARGCAPAEALPCREEALDCFELEARCRTACDVSSDADGDGVDSTDCGGTDCADDDPGRFPGNLETCDFVGHDEDCDRDTFGSDRDVDGDGAVDARCSNVWRNAEGEPETTSQGADCDDLRAFVAPGVEEACNGRDDDCDGAVDEGVTVARWPDRDGDGDGAMGPDVEQVMVCPGDTGASATATDCDDTDPLVRGAPWFELCDNEDNDCDGTVDEDPRAVAWYMDADGDGFGDGDGPVVISCAPVPGRSLLGTDCDDGRSQVRPGNPERCNGLDDDCNGRLDYLDPAEGFSEDEDGDGVPSLRCYPAGDCDDADFFTGGDAPELCGDMVDNDCDGAVDEAGAMPVDWYPDLDGDGWGDEAAAVVATRCERVERASFRVSDCDDASPSRHPFVPDGCDGVDDDCDGALDEDAPRRSVFRDTDGDGAGVETDSLLVCGATPAGFADFPRDCAPADPAETFRWADGDMDGVGGGEPLLTCGGGVPVGGDCDDTDPAITSGCVELCNGVDDDGDALVDETGASGCPNAGSTTWACNAGLCQLMGCAGMGADCDLVAANGCEADLETSPRHCGGCATTCGVGADCVAASCTGTVVDIAIGTARSCALRDNGRVVCWGRLPPDAPVVQRAEPTPETMLLEGGAPVTDASWLSVGPVAWCIGRASDGAMRCATSADSYDVGAHGVSMRTGMALSLPVGLTTVDTSSSHGCGLGPGGIVVCWGRDHLGQLGRGNEVDGTYPPEAVLGIAGATRVAVGGGHSCAVVGGAVRCWGQTALGQLGVPGPGNATTPVSMPLADTATDPVLDVACAGVSTCVLRTSGKIECAGSIGGSGFSETTPTLVGTVAGATEIVGGENHFCVATPTGAFCFGNDGNGRLGNGPSLGATITPDPVVGLTDVVSIDASASHSCALTSTGEVWCWGLNGNGQLGTRTGSLEVPGRVLNLP